MGSFGKTFEGGDYATLNFFIIIEFDFFKCA